MKLSEFWASLGADTDDKRLGLIAGWIEESVVPALCDHGCEIEPDGLCQHDQPSILIKLGFI